MVLSGSQALSAFEVFIPASHKSRIPPSSLGAQISLKMSNNAIKKAFSALFGSAGVPATEAKLDAESKRLFKELVDTVDDGEGQEFITRADLCE